MANAVGVQTWHAMMAVPDHDELSRQLFVQSYQKEVGARLAAGNQAVLEKRVGPDFAKQHGRPIREVNELRKAMMKDPFVQTWSSLKRVGKELQYEAVGPSVERQLPDLIDRARAFRDSNRKKGTLTLDPTIRAPRYNTEIEIHCKPGGYHTELTEDDVFAGAEFDRTLYMIVGGGFGSECDDMGRAVSGWVKKTWPALRPRRILDMGCTVGHSTLPWARLYPEAEVHAIDVAAPCLRFGHARAEALGVPVHFVQDDAEHTRYPDGHFDIVVSHILLHELSTKALRNIFRECHRLLAKGGVMAHMDGPQYRDIDLIDQFPHDWDVHYNAEPFITTLHKMDLAQEAVDAGFAKTKVQEVYIPTLLSMAKDDDPRRGGGRQGGERYVVAAQK